MPTSVDCHFCFGRGKSTDYPTTHHQKIDRHNAPTACMQSPHKSSLPALQGASRSSSALSSNEPAGKLGRSLSMSVAALSSVAARSWLAWLAFAARLRILSNASLARCNLLPGGGDAARARATDSRALKLVLQLASSAASNAGSRCRFNHVVSTSQARDIAMRFRAQSTFALGTLER